MTREEAIKQLKIELSKWESECKSYHKTKDALKKGIEALEQEPCEDSVSRDAIRLKITEIPKYTDGKKSASVRHLKDFWEKELNEPIDVTPDMCVGFTMALEYIGKFIKDLPSVTPATKWTPVSESFPKEHIYDDGYVEPSETVLVQLNNGEMKTSRYWGSKESRKNEPWIDLSYPTTLEVVAWRPLPNKYSAPHDSRCKTEV